MKVKGSATFFDTAEILQQIFEAAQSVGGKDKQLADKLSQKVAAFLKEKYPKRQQKVDGEVDDAIEQVLMEEGHINTARAFILKRKQLADYRKQISSLGIKDELGLPYNSVVVIKNKYLQKDELGKVTESTNEWLLRVAKALAKAEDSEKDRQKAEKEFYLVMSSLEFLPAGRTLANAGTINGQLANCFVLPLEDNVEEIFEAVKDSSILKKNGGGVGFSFSKIRPKGDFIATTTGSACGPVALMKILDSASEILLQAGGRRSGNMVVLSVSHPDVLEFISCKEQQNVLNQINYSLGISDKFMDSVVKNKDWALVNPRTGRVVQKVSAKSIFELASYHAWKNGDPGMIFLDRINKDNPTPHVGPIEAVNLCGEQPLLPYEACNLGSINLVKMLKVSGSKYKVLSNEKYEVDWEKLERTVRVATRMLDNVITVCRYPLAQVDRVVKANRKIGLGVMGWADILVKMCISYDSDESLRLAEKLMKFITDTSHDESQKLGRKKGSFSNFPGSLWQKKGYRAMRNSTCTTIAPTGSISMTAGVSSGIEPLFALSYFKQVMGGMKLPEINKELLKEIEKLNLGPQKEEIIEEIVHQGSVQQVNKISETLKKVFVTAMDIDPLWHVRMQAAFQKYTDNAVSKTINLSQNATTKDVEKAFLLAHKLGCKGITVYRDKSRDLQVLNVGFQGSKVSPSVVNNKINVILDPDSCPNCQGKLVREEGCLNCPSCGFSACSV
ncbi:adenosylcobalamin-dependent ribonucleoside-diphosphate reductase [Candidatus Microgenomates bacterium]|nr:adenosylcobalamin-dependent ribonucleoside-diphosphate reductase [Candidatus Microgenomates bacterium]